jgi:hypothetical protein
MPGHRCARLLRVSALGLLCGISAGCAPSLRLTLLAAAAQPPSNVALYLDAADARGQPIVDLRATDFRIYEDGKLVSPERSRQTIASPEVAAQHFIVLLIDISSAVMTDQAASVRAAAQAWIARVAPYQRVAVYAFDGGGSLHEIVSFSGDGHGLDALRTIEARDPATNLNGAVLLGLSELGRAVQAAKVPMRSGTLIVLTDGSDRSARISQRQMLDAVDAAPYRVYTLGIGRELDDSVLSRIGKTGYIRVEDSAATRAAFDELAELNVRAARRRYLLRYCSAARGGKHTLHVEVDATAGRGRLGYALDAASFSGGCDTTALPRLMPLTARRR